MNTLQKSYVKILNDEAESYKLLNGQAPQDTCNQSVLDSMSKASSFVQQKKFRIVRI